MPGQEASLPPELLGHVKIVGIFCMACAAIGYSWVVYKELSGNWYILRPGHMLQASYLCTTVLALVWSISMVLSQEHHNRHISEVLPDLHFCVLHTVGLSVKLHHLQALVLLQLERFLDVRKPFLSEQVTVRHTGHAMAVSLLITLALTAVAVVMDRASLINLNNFINPVNIYMVSYPKVLAIILTLMVSAVLTNEVHRLNAEFPIWAKRA